MSTEVNQSLGMRPVEGGDDTMQTIDDLLRSTADNHFATVEFRRRPSVEECRSVLKVDQEYLPHNLTSTTLAGDDMISGNPYVFIDNQGGCILAFYYLGRSLAGHPGIVHGGISAVLLDECMGRACFPKLAGKVAVTAKMELQYKSPIKVGSVVLVRAITKEVQGRKAWVEAEIDDALDGQILVQAAGLFIEPKWAAGMAKVL